jgi:hypothetical protein
VRRALSPSLNPAGLTSAGLAVFAAVVMILNAYNKHGVIDAPVIVAAVGAVAALLTRQAVTPVKDPRDGNGTPLLTVASVAAAQAAQPLTVAASSGNVRPVPPPPAGYPPKEEKLIISGGSARPGPVPVLPDSAYPPGAVPLDPLAGPGGPPEGMP